MNRSTIALGALLAGITLFVMLVFFLGVGGEKNFSSPQEVFEAAKSAIHKDDLYAWSQCLTDDSRDLFAANGIAESIVTKQALEKTGNEDQKAMIRAMDQVMAKHGLSADFLAKHQDEASVLSDPAAPMEEKRRFAETLLKPVKDRNEFIEDLHRAILKGPAAENHLKIWKDSSLSDVKIQGDTAQATITFKQQGQERTSPLQFRKQGSGWRIDLNAPRPKQPEFHHP